MGERYQHQQLHASRSIRVLILEPASRTSVELRCDLIEVSIDEPPEYEALSYSWDAQLPSHSINCHGNSLLITPNCEAALIRLRNESESRTLWVDSICIDQSSTQERNKQVRMMGEIYKIAKQVLVWLGEGNSESKRALRYMADINNWIRISDAQHQRLLDELIQQLKKDNMMDAIFKRSWFSRMWTVQEVTLAEPDKSLVLCGEDSLPWMDFAVAVDCMVKRHHLRGTIRDATELQIHLLLIVGAARHPEAKEILDNKPGYRKAYPIASQIFWHARRKSSTDPKDKVYALYGLFNELGIDFPTPDYRKPIEEIYRESAIACINYDKNLLILYMAPSRRRLSGLSSWVPDWSDAGWNSGDPATAMYSNFHAAASLNLEMSFSDDQKYLILPGKIVDRVIFCAEALDEDPNQYLGIDRPQEMSADTHALGNRLQALHKLFQTLKSWVEKLGHFFNIDGPQEVSADRFVVDDQLRAYHKAFLTLKSWIEISGWCAGYPTGETIQEALCSTLFRSLPTAETGIQDGDFDAWYGVMTSSDLGIMALVLESTNLPSTTRNNAAFLSACMAEIPVEVKSRLALAKGPPSSFNASVIAFCRGLTFFVTENGFMGTAPDLIQAGDLIALFSGVEMPMAVRAMGGHHHLVTHAYVHGIMQGEAWSKKESELVDITLV